MAINLMAPKGNDQNVKLSTEIWKKLNEVKTAKLQEAAQQAHADKASDVEVRKDGE
ncbi:hypothetical protein G3N57_05275 [Paraburkholderia sp. Se-20369]|nr:hypothetical protein [Paraburkholderia sp. Se-20369]